MYWRTVQPLREAEDLAADQLSRFQNPHMEELTEREFADKFSDKYLMVLKSKFKDNEPCVFKDANEYVRRCDACQRSGNISSRNEMPQNNIQLEKALQRYGVTHKLSMMYHPQSNGKIEVTNRATKRILERSVGYNPKGPREGNIDEYWWRIYKSGNFEVLES
ncbi:reverse transcriptase domain-containing protein [Tanacetum coccineum]